METANPNFVLFSTASYGRRLKPESCHDSVIGCSSEEKPSRFTVFPMAWLAYINYKGQIFSPTDWPIQWQIKVIVSKLFFSAKGGDMV